MYEISEKNDLIKNSEKDVFIALIFAKSTAKTFSKAVDIAKKARLYQESSLKDLPVYIAGFAKTHDGAKNALALYEIVKGWKSLKILTVDGVPSRLEGVKETLRCYESSFSSKKLESYCKKDYKILPSMEEVSRFLGNQGGAAIPERGIHTLPCKLLYGFALTERSLEYEPDPCENIFKTAQRRSCNWCPNFDFQNYVRIYSKDEVETSSAGFLERIKNYLSSKS